ncbi:MAG: HNH endonuclease [Deltaproteobacteria bacterium]|nr:HNH endonuclease [Deltaproteobacteria bacterium]
MINSSVLVLNRSFYPVHVTTVRRAFCLLYSGIAKVVDAQYNLFDFKSWTEISLSLSDEVIGTVDRLIKVPRVIIILTFDRFPKRGVRFNRYNIFTRDRDTCQYCGEHFPRGELSLDHVVPISRGGRTTWSNVICSCVECNKRKGGRLPKEAGMKLRKKPVKPAWNPEFSVSFRYTVYKEWIPFLNIVDFTYWNLELES